MSRFFIDRPIFAWVIAIVIMLAGGLAIGTLPVSQYPAIAPPSISITAIYPGASAQTLENTVTQIIEQQMKGLDHLEYLSSTSDSSGQVVVTLTFQQGTNPDIAQVQVQNKLQLATPLLPTQVQQQGLVVAKATRNFLLIMALYSQDGSHTNADLGDYIVSNMQDPLSRVTGVGDTQVFGGQYAMRIWLDPYKLNSFNLTTSDVKQAILAQNAQVSAGQVGAAPSVPGQQLNAVITAQSRLQTPEQFRGIVLKTNTDGSTVKLADVARVELGQDSYGFVSRFNGHPAAGFAIKLAPGANALNTAKAVKAEVAQLSAQFPPDVKVDFPVDTTPFVKISIEEVVKTLFEAVVLVFIVMFVFLQDWRATLIPTIAVPVVLLGTFGVLAVFGFSINTLTLFAMVLAIGLLVDDAIVVVENVERLMTQEGLGPKEAARRSMDEITGALIGIVLVLSAVFLPMAFFSGSTGVIYRQFSITIVSAMVLSVLVALILTPALCATLLKKHDEPRKKRGFFAWFNKTFDKGVHSYEGGLRRTLKGWIPAVVVYIVIVGVLAFFFIRLPTGFLPEEDQGSAYTLIQLPPGATFERTDAVVKQVEKHFLEDEKANVEGIFTVQGFSFAGSGQNAGIAFIHLKDWSQRKGAKNRAPAIAARAMGAFSGIRDALVFAVIPPAVQELGNSSGFDFELKDIGGVGHAKLAQAEGMLLGMASKEPGLVAVRPNGLPDVPQLKVDVDPPRATALGLSVSDINDVLSTAWGSSYVDQFIDRGRVKRIYVQGDAPFRSKPEDLDRWYVRGSTGALAPFSSFSTTSWVQGPAKLERYNGLPAMEIVGQPAPGQSTGAAIATMERLAKQLPPGVGYEWTGLTYEEQASGNQAPLLYGLSILVVFLCLAALYESWSVPLAVVLVIPLGIVGALLAATARGLTNDVYLQVGLLTTMGLASKNAILIVEFAEGAQREGKSAFDAAMEAARLRLRPILMTSLAFIAGVLPLAISTGAGSGSQNDIGTGVVGGMLSATVLAIFFVPLFFVLVNRVFKPKVVGMPDAPADRTEAPAAPQRPETAPGPRPEPPKAQTPPADPPAATAPDDAPDTADDATPPRRPVRRTKPGS
jgi:hydrophobe/amphiphile efflux-1 (HAE1) family protein